MKDFHDMQVWKKAHDLTIKIYHATASFPKDELFGLVSQLRRAAVSIPSNIAEGCGRGGVSLWLKCRMLNEKCRTRTSRRLSDFR